MKPVIVHNSRLAKVLKVSGIVLYPFIFFSDVSPHNELVRHEMIHVEQIKKHGAILFYFLYLKEYLINRLKGMDHNQAYLAISFEKEAYEGQHQG